ncbi:MAG TPA: molybdopterin cofactor-binding domain-containing protein [Bryobacteraceae bacterium]|jgi:isoquinoline 1-oxidoreductase|nr:molybdopterin cofactor-binding domain-containing protein [Bryobacteraceae bacterium]
MAENLRTFIERGLVTGASFTRREALKRLGSGTLFLFSLRNAKAGGQKQPFLTSRLHIGEDGIVTVLTGKVECGQGVRTTLTQVAAEELSLEPGRVRLIMGDTALVPDDGGTWGSLTTPETVPVIRKACSAMRELLCRCAASEWHADLKTLTVTNGQISGTGGRIYAYRDLTRSPLLANAVSADARSIDPNSWRVCGTSLRAINGAAIVRGALPYSSDLVFDRALHGRVLHPPNHRCTLGSFDASEAEHLPEVRVVHDGNFLGVTAPTPDQAAAAVAVIRAEWTNGELGDPRNLFADLKAKAKPPELKEAGRYPALLEAGSLAVGMEAAEHKLEATYHITYIGHVPLEARTAIAQWQGDQVTVHCGTQAPFSVRGEIAKALNIPAENVRVIVSDTGSGYGAKHNSECELEAVRLARGTQEPVRLAWSRHEEFTQAYCRPAAVMEVRSGVQGDGKILAWEFHNYNGGAASLAAPYQIPNRYAAYHASESPLRQGSYRSLAAVGNTFARETHVDELAAMLKLDPLEIRLRNIDNARLKAVLTCAAERFGWGKSRSGNGVGYGLACNVEKGGHLALFTELEVDGSNVHLKRMVAAFDVGAIINPDILSNQVEGAIIQGIGGALFEQLEFDKTRILNGRLVAYRVPRFTDVPDIEVILVDHRDIPSAGAGESPITTTAPSIGSALFAATGKRIRELPMLPAFAGSGS